VLSAIWGSAFVAIKVSVELIHPVSVASFRLLIGALFLYSFCLIKRYRFSVSKKNIILIIIIGLAGNFIPFFLISWSEQYIQSNTAGLLLSVAPIFTLLLSHFFTKDDKFTLLKFISVIVGLIGVLFIIGFDTFDNFASNNHKTIIPKIAIILSALGYVISSILAYNLKKMNIMILTTLVTISAALISVPFMIYTEIYFPSSLSINSLLSIIYLGLFPTAIAFQLRFHIISKAGPIFLSYVAYLIPAFAILWGYLFLDEKINLDTSIGVILILIGLFISQKKYSMSKITQ